ncbi:MAG TPA: hypothetical protein GX707_09615 [Epulopiscium sp.]|nr:hypothetical protein [Candidatus Epulonipiscium sp.]
MAQRNQGMRICSQHLDGKRGIKSEKRTMEIMIKGYQEMAEINLKISKLCFAVESEADDICIRLTECE